MPRIVNTIPIQESLIPVYTSTDKPVIYTPAYTQLNFQFLSKDESELYNEYKRFVPFLFSFPGRQYCTYSEFAVRNGFRLETGIEVTEAMSQAVLDELKLSGEVLYIYSEFHGYYRYASVGMKQAKSNAS